MAESDCEIEYLDEDAEIVQQCFQTQPQVLPERLLTERVPLLVERPDKRRKRKKDDDSDYDPSEDYTPPSPPSPKSKKKKGYVLKKSNKSQEPGPYVKNKSYIANQKTMKLIVKAKENRVLSPREHLANRKKLNIKIPDYEDPLCLPVRAIKQESRDVKRLTVWNNVCLEHFKKCDVLLKPERGDTKGSTRSIILRNVANKQTGKVETTICSKTSVESVEGEKKSEIFQCVLPRYKEKKTINTYPIIMKKPKPYRLVDEVVLTKEEHKNGEALVAYKPKESLSSVYMMFKEKNNSEDCEPPESEISKIHLKEMTCCKVCSQCYQSSYRRMKKIDKKSIVCPICARSYVTVYNLLSHFKTHSADQIKSCKHIISSILSGMVEYLYKCRICLEKFNSIKRLRQHVKTHQGGGRFTCEVGNHLVG